MPRWPGWRRAGCCRCFGLKPARPAELAAFRVPAGRRAAVFDESLELIRRLLSEPEVSFHGEFFTVESASIGPRPAKPLDIWVGGSAPGALRRAGRLADGWLASFLTPAEAGAGRVAIEAAAAEAGREIEPDHFGISLAVATGPALARLREGAQQRRPDADPAALVADGWADARRKIEDYVLAGLTKFVVRPGAEPDDPQRFADEFAREMLPLQN